MRYHVLHDPGDGRWTHTAYAPTFARAVEYARATAESLPTLQRFRVEGPLEYGPRDEVRVLWQGSADRLLACPEVRRAQHPEEAPLA